MINRALTSTFDLPQDQFSRQGAADPRQPRLPSAGPSADKMDDYFGLDKMATGLQYTGEIAKQSEQYYQEREKLRQFARSNWLNNKIDVTAPDPSNPAAVRAAQIYQMGLANLNYQGDKLKQSQEMFKPALELQQKNEYQFGEDVGNVAFAEQTPEQMGYATTLSPTMKAAADAVNKDFSNYGQFRQAQGIAGNVQGMANQAAIGGGARQQLEKQQAQVIFNPDYNPPAPREGGTGKDSGTLNFVERFVNHKNGGGNWEPSKSYTEDGQVFLESGDYKGTRMGKVTVMVGGKEQDLEAIVEKTVRNPQTGETKFIFTNSNIPPYSLTGAAANQAIESMASNNAKYPSLTKIQDFLIENNLLQDGVILEDRLVTDNTRKKSIQNAEKALKTPTRTKEVLQEVGKTQSGFGLNIPFVGYVGLPRGSKEYQTQFGPVKARQYSNGKYEITSPDGKKQEDLSESDFIRYMRAYGIDIAPSTTNQPSAGFDPTQF